MELTLGQQLGRYRIEDKIGQGGMGSVYRATDTRLDREVAIKVLPAELTTDAERRQRFRQEAQLAAAFNHPNIATVHDVGEQDGATFIVMEFVRGESLRDLVRDEPLRVERAVDIVVQQPSGIHRQRTLELSDRGPNPLAIDGGMRAHRGSVRGRRRGCSASVPGGAGSLR